MAVVFGSILVLAQVQTRAADQILETPQGVPRLVLDGLPAAVRAAIEPPYDKAREDPDDASAVGRLAMVLHAHEQYQMAEACYRRASILEPRFGRWPYLRGVMQAELGNFADAVHSFRRALALEPGDLSARLRLADALMRNADLDASRAAYDALIRDFPELAVAHYGRGRVLTMRGEHQSAAADYRQAVQSAPQFGAAHYALALGYRDAGMAELADTHLTQYRRWGSSRPVPADAALDEVFALKSSARDLIARGARLGAGGNLGDSVALHLEALAADPAAAQAHVNLISLYGRLGNRPKAEEHYQAALRLGGSIADAHYNYGVLLASARLTAQAAEAFRKALDANPFHPKAHHNLASLLAADGRLEEAASHYRHTLANDPGHRGARLNLGRTLVAMGRPREALVHLERLLVPEDADTPRAAYALATAWLAANDAGRARTYAEQALRGANALGQTELAARIRLDLEKMPKGFD